MLKLDSEYYITADVMSFQLMRKYKPTKEATGGRKTRDEKESVVGYYPNVASCINRYRTEQMKNWIATERMNLEQLCDRITELDATLKKKMRQLVEMEDKQDESTEVGRVVVATDVKEKRTRKTGGKKNDSHEEN